MDRAEPSPSRRDDYAAATRDALLSAARELFAQLGFRATSLAAIAAAARVTRGALYHHFADKTALFDAVVVSLQREAVGAIAARARAERDVSKRINVGMDAYLDECLRPEYRRLVIEESPAVLGAQRYRSIGDAHSLRLLIATLDALVARGELDCEDTDFLARMLDAMICEVALLLPDATDADKVRAQGHAAVSRLLDSYRPVLARVRQGR